MPHRAANTALDLRRAIGWPGFTLPRCGFSPDEALADFVLRHVGPPATGRREDEPVVIYSQEQGPGLTIGAYGSEQRVRGWLPGLAPRICPATASKLSPIRPMTSKEAKHQPWQPADLDQLPIPLLTRRDAGRYLSMGFVLSQQAGHGLALSAHRMLALGSNRLGIWMLRDRKLRQHAEMAHVKGEPLPISINIGVAPCVAVASATSSAILPEMIDKLSLAGALASASVELGQGDEVCFLNDAEIVLEGHLLAETVPEAMPGTPLDGSMPEFLGYDGTGQAALNLVQLHRMRLRPNALFQTVAGPGREQSTLLGLGGALSLAIALEHETAIHNLRFSHAGGGMLLLFVALEPHWRGDLDALARSMITVCPFIKNIIFVDRDVDLSNEEDILWAMTTRANLVQDCHALEGYPATAMDPSQKELWSRAGSTTPVAYKSYIDATVPKGMGRETNRSFAQYASSPAAEIHTGSVFRAENGNISSENLRGTT